MAGFGNLRAYESKTTKKKTTTKKTTTKTPTISTAAANTGKYSAPSSSYRAEIERKLKTGSKFTDEAAARKAAPDLFAKYSKTPTPAKTTTTSRTTSSGRRPTGYESLPLPESIQRSRTSMATYRPEAPKSYSGTAGKYFEPGPLGIPTLKPSVAAAVGEAVFGGNVLAGGEKLLGNAVRRDIPRIIPKVRQNVPRIVSAAEQAAPRAPEHLWGRTYQIARNVLQRGGQTLRQGVKRAGNLPLVRTLGNAGSQLRNAPPLIKVGGTIGAGGAALYGLDRLSSQGAPAPGGGPSAPSPGPQPQILPPSDANTQNVMTPGGGGYVGGNAMTTYGGTAATGTGAGGQTMDTTAFPPLPGEQAQAPLPEQPLPEQPPMPEQPDWNAMLQQYYDVIQQSAQQNAALATSFLNNALQQLDQLQAQIMAQYQQMGQGIDPATQAALQNLRDEINMRRQNLMEEMNRRGLLQSGVWLEMENRILKGQMTQEEQLIASRLADVQNQMTDALMQFASQRMNLMSQAAQNQMSIGQWAGQAQLGALENVQTQQNQWNQWWQGIQEQRRQQAQEQARWQYEQNLARAQQIADWTGTIPQGFPEAGQPTWDARMAQQELALQQQRAASGGGGGSLSTQYKIAKEAEEEAWNRAIDNYVATNFPKFRTKADLVAQLYRNYPNIVAQYGIDGFRAILDEANNLPDSWMGQGWLTAHR